MGSWLLPVAAFSAELKVSEVWCMQVGNRNMVIATAAYEGLGKIKGKGGLYVPSGSNDDQPLTIGQWRQQRPSEFARICDKAYRALSGNPTEQDPGSDQNDQLSDVEEAVLSVIAGGVVAGIGVVGGYGLTRLSTRDERKYLRAGALILANANLKAALKDLQIELKEGGPSPAIIGETIRLAKGLEAQLPREPAEEVEAVSQAVSVLTSAIEERDEAGLETAGTKLDEAVGHLVGNMSKDARIRKP
jgi:hypothetical protein